MSDTTGLPGWLDPMVFAWLAFAVLAIETVIVFALLRQRNRRLAISLAFNGLSGLSLMGALLTGLVGGMPVLFVLWLAAALVAHLIDLRSRLVQGS
ncbi:MAG: hypothetical protein AAGC96_11765 [Pseudomonadota bacterium]